MTKEKISDALSKEKLQETIREEVWDIISNIVALLVILGIVAGVGFVIFKVGYSEGHDKGFNEAFYKLDEAINKYGNANYLNEKGDLVTVEKFHSCYSSPYLSWVGNSSIFVGASN